MRIRWHGHSCFEISDGKTTIVTDPHDGRSLGIRPPSVSADIVLISHDHYDHSASRVVNGNFKIFQSRIGRFESRGLQFNGIETYHDAAKGTQRGLNTMYKFQMDGITVCHCGDLGAVPSPRTLNSISGVDILFVPTGGIYTMESKEIEEFIRTVGPGVTVPMHYRVGGLTVPVRDIDYFLDMVTEESVRYVGNCVDVTQDELPEYKECWVFDR
ncbi:MAG: MBL fold metallo-hydrolase [Candidatus Methanomethylophilaceae archaeon]|nr:MBL fold metallo-hydrolase [Candidatus Methanomethylophilaceae archaeon]